MAIRRIRIDVYRAGELLQFEPVEDLGPAREAWRSAMPPGHAFTARQRGTGKIVACMGIHKDAVGGVAWAAAAKGLSAGMWADLVRAVRFICERSNISYVRAHASGPAEGKLLQLCGFEPSPRPTRAWADEEWPRTYVRLK